MPHLHLETTADLPENADIPDILEALCECLVERFQLDPARTRACHTLRSVWYVGQGAPAGFVHLTVSLLSGRETGWRREVALAMVELLKQRFESSVAAGEACVTVEVREMVKDAYARL